MQQNEPPNQVMTPEIQKRLMGRYTRPGACSFSDEAFCFYYYDDEGNELTLRSQDGWVVYRERRTRKTPYLMWLFTGLYVAGLLFFLWTRPWLPVFIGSVPYDLCAILLAYTLVMRSDPTTTGCLPADLEQGWPDPNN